MWVPRAQFRFAPPGWATRDGVNWWIGTIVDVVDPALVVGVLGGGDCERIGAGWLAQPANAVSSLAYVAAGAWLLRRSAVVGTERGLLVGAGAALAAIGMGSVAFHGPQPAWAATAPDAAIWSLPAGLVTHAGRRYLTRGRTEAVLGSRHPTGRRLVGFGDRGWRTAGAWAIAGLAAYLAGRTGSSLCRPDSLWQFHAVWHVLSAGALGGAVLALAGSENLRSAGDEFSAPVPSK